LAIERLTVAQAATRLGVTQDAIRKRISRNTIDYDQDPDGRIHVYVDSSKIGQDKSSDASTEKLVEVQHQEIEFLRRQLETRTEEIRRRDSIIAGLTQRIPELEAPLESQLTLENTTLTDHPTPEGPAGSQEVQRGAHKAWWRRLTLVAVLLLGVVALWLTSLLVALYILYS
jgi:hypothetical protein